MTPLPDRPPQKTQLLEAVPNISLGRDTAAVDELVAAAGAAGAYVAHRDTSASANRTVITLIGSPREVVASCSALIDTASHLIDMRTHTGTHPCVGAVDVAPFVPIGDILGNISWADTGITDVTPNHTSPHPTSASTASEATPIDVSPATLADAIESARTLATWAAAKHHLPTFLYGAAATIPAHQSLPFLRKGGMNELARRLATGEIHPDAGPSRLHPTLGALITGAREILIAYNIQLATTDPKVATAIARAIRTSGPPGRPHALPGLRAIGWYEEAHQCAEVSCNLLDYRTTGLRAVWDAVRAIAADYGCYPVSSDIIGLVPRAALYEGAESIVGEIRLNVCRPFEGEARTVEAACWAAVKLQSFSRKPTATADCHLLG